MAPLSSPSARITAIGVFTATSAVPSGDQNFAERAFVRRLDFHRRLVGLDLGNDVAGLDLIALFLEPFGEIALLHGRRERGHENLDRHERTVVSYRVTQGRSAIHIGNNSEVLGLRIVGGKFGRLIDLIANCAVDLLQCILADKFRSRMRCRTISIGSCVVRTFVDFFAGAVLRRIRHRMAAITVGQHFQNVRSFAFAAPCDRLCRPPPSPRAHPCRRPARPEC